MHWEYISPMEWAFIGCFIIFVIIEIYYIWIHWDDKKNDDDDKKMLLSNGLNLIRQANPSRHFGNLHRRMIKIMEELGEASEAYLNVTSASNGKGKSYADLREELIDAMIVAADCALTPTPDQDGMTEKQIADEFMTVLNHKLAKWKRNRDTSKVAPDAE